MRLRAHLHFPAIAAGLLTCLCNPSASPISAAGEIPAPQALADTNTFPGPVAVAVEEALRQLKEQQKEQQASASQALQLILDHTETALHRNAVTVSNQLAQFSVALADYSDRQFQLMRSTESRTLRVTLLILLIVVLTAAALLLLAARALRTLTHRFSGAAAASSYALEPPPGPQALLDQAADSAYTAAMLDVEKRIAMLENRQTSVPAATGEAGVPSAAAQAGPRSPSPAKLKATPLALALGSGEALMFLPRDRSQADSRVVSALGRIGRLFARTTPASRLAPIPKPPKS